MRREVRGTIEMALRVREFSRAHPLTDPVAAAVEGRFEERLTQAEAFIVRQGTSRDAAKAATARKNVLKTMPLIPLLRHLSSVADAASAERPDLAGKFKAPSIEQSARAFRAKVQGLKELATEHHEVLEAHGMPPSMLADLDTSVALYDEVAETSRVAVRERIAAREQLEVLRAGLMESVKLLGGLYRYQFRADPEKLAEWTSVSNLVVRVPGKAAAPPAEGGTASAA